MLVHHDQVECRGRCGGNSRISYPIGLLRQKIGETFTAVETTGIAGNERYRQRQAASGGTSVEVYFDELQREVRRKGKAFIDGTYATTTLAYDAAAIKQAEFLRLPGDAVLLSVR